MALIMARPMRRKGSTFHQLKKRIPQDVLHKARGAALAVPVGGEVSRISLGPKAESVTVSLRTRDPREAKERQTVALAYLDAFWQSLRTGPITLTHKQSLALAGEAYQAFVATFEDDPGSPEVWEAGIRLHAAKLASEPDTIEQWLGPSIDEVLARHRLIIDKASWERLLINVGVALAQAADRLRRNAAGDYGPDDIATRFPAFEKPGETAPVRVARSASTQTVTGLVEGWWREASAAGKAYSTYEAYERAARQFVEFIGHDDAHTVTQGDVIRYKDYRIEQGASLKTIGGSDLSGLRSLFSWGVKNRKVDDNPVKGVGVIAPKKARTRPKGFTDDEANQLLAHALRHKRGDLESAKIFAAKKWVPWLCSYNGARVGEMVQLRKQDIRCEAGLWIITITPEAGTVKDKEFREVPLHAHLVELGFPEFVKKAGDGYLFLNPKGHSEKAVRGAWRTVKNRVTEFVREVVTDKAVQPNHAWRHRFMSVGRDLEIPPDIRYAITGHAPGEEGAKYGDVSIKAKATAIAKFPRYLTLHEEA